MKRILLFVSAIALSFACGQKAHAACGPLSGTVSQSSFASAIASCSSGQTLSLASGTTVGPFTSTVTVPCGVSISGPTVAYSQTPNQTAAFVGSSSFIGWALQYGACSSSTPMSTIQYVSWDGKRPSDGGGFITYLNGTNNATFQYNWAHGNNAPDSDSSGQNYQADLVNLGGGSGGNGSTINNVNILWNVFGASGDCASATETNTESGGGFCNGVGMGANMTNVTVSYNIFQYMEQGAKAFEHQGTANPVTMTYNSFNSLHRIYYETQEGISNTGATQTVNMTIDYNDFYGRPSSGQQNYELSAANGCVTPDPTNCVTHSDYNVEIGLAPSVGFEIWGGNGTTASGNLIQGTYYNGITWSQNGAFTLSNNNFYASASGSSQSCEPRPSGGYWNWESGNVTSGYTPTCSGNTFTTPNAVVTSVTPTVSPASGSFSSSVTVTLTNPGTGRDTNTSIWYTLDGSTPTPGTSLLYTGPLTLTSTKTLKYRGMWGAANQPYSYPTNYGYVPSAVQTATYTLTGGGPKTLSSVALALTGNDTSIHPGQTNQASVTCTYSDGSTDSCSSYTVTWASSATGVATISGTGLVTAVGNGSTNLTATANGVASPAVSLTVATLTSITVSSAGGNTIHVGATSQLTATCNYSNGYSDNCDTLDLYDYTASWVSGTPAKGTVSSSGLFTAVAVGSTVITASAGSVSGTLTITVATATISSIALTMSGNITTLQVGGSDAINAVCTYSDSSTANCTPTSFASSNTSVATVNSSGLVTGVAAGSTNLTGTLSGVTSSSLGLTVAAGTPTFSSGYMANQGSINTVSVGTQVQFSAVCIYTDGDEDNCSSIGGVTGWTTSNSAVMTMSALGLAQCVATGTANAQAQIGSNHTSPWGMTCTAAPALSSVSLALYGGVTSIPVGANVQEVLTCTYADGSSDNCTGPADTRGNVGSGFTSSSTGVATVSTSGLVTPVANGTTTLSATAGGKTATLNITVTGGASGPTLVSAYQTNAGPTSTLTLYTNPLIQQHAMCVYSDSVTTDCTFGDTRGSAVTAWTAQYSGAIVSIGAIGSTTPGIVSPMNAGRANTNCTVTGGIPCTPFTWTVIYPPRSVLTAPGMKFSGVKTH